MITTATVPPRILIIDDSQTIRRSAENLLLDEGYTVLLAQDGFDALSKVVANEPDLVFVDVMMPRLDGYQTCALLKNHHRYAELPVVMLSSRDSIFDKARGRLVGADGYLTKPFTRGDLVQAVQQHLEQSA